MEFREGSEEDVDDMIPVKKIEGNLLSFSFSSPKS